MGRLLAAVVAIGLLIGFILPSGKAKSAKAAATGVHEAVLTRGSTGHFYTDAQVNGAGKVNFIVDTGATIVALTMADAERLGVEVDPDTFRVVGEGAGGPVRGTDIVLDSIEVEGIRVEKVQAVVLEGSNMSLLGQSFLSHVDQVTISGDYLSLKDEA